MSNIDQLTSECAMADWHADGLPELMFGLAYLTLGGVPALLWTLDRRASLSSLLVIWVGFMVLLFLDRRILAGLRERIGSTRTPAGGITQVHWDDQNAAWFRNRTLAVFLLSFSFMMLVQNEAAPATVMAGAAAMLYWGNRRGEQPYSRRSLLALGVSGIPFCWAGLPAPVRGMLPFMLGGAWLAARGARSLRRYLRKNPPPGEEFSGE
jgi:hypothetical protein